MSEGLPLAHSYNLARLGNAGDEVRFSADESERAGIAKWSGVQSIEKLEVRTLIKKLESNRFGLNFDLEAEVTQSCVVTLEPIPAQIRRTFSRELVFVGPSRRDPAPAESDAVVGLNMDEADEGPEEITSLHVDLAGPALEEFILALDPYPRRPGVQFAPKTGETSPSNNPFAVLKGLK
jgi:uncharacterized metal-binding protein YceD (DUF177 family)